MNTAAYLPYQLTLSPSSGTASKNSSQTLTVTGIVLGADYQAAIPGTYSDTVIISIHP